ncbi:class I SAM-dependent methyltransferase [Fischerella thermalis]|jgi:ubiquinone/menaquinone biosynthesis C-methylase UbiE|uniref:class I SAM-dependent methyltransferase n=1 Tax=Fischerella thermalis TaxID=372787 RepID=UPI0002ECD9E1|nr:class I SAM-dependent methyltransferase [Fischerella thermalis]PMB12996.1 class I SAM-dependent methyltransferase [Fischerella thermalis CCMEE 5328]PLZ08031.1 class I SAM-dependent methyltransferase [Fischerella thermalis WC1110]PLZ11978.1 class I SAM-dependent methyltransferase [Fischerella thermalis WC114]PLZ15683.1 class I SAM-dependent methyltransferase [Fischerella thermalis WC119]PLZ24051.1 class I SAM-dependent methyltransferase [Fischerella thermalis WC157]
MGFYSQKILPYLIDWSLSDPSLAKYRQEVLANVEGEVLEIGFGSGVNLSYYPEHIHKIITVDVNPGIHALAQKRIQASSITVDHHILSGENLPMADHAFNSVVSTWTLCSIENVEQALKEIYRVLKPGGRFFFIEHGLSNEPNVQVWQNRLTPLQKIIAGGCQLNRNIRQILENQFDTVSLEEFYAEKTPKIIGYLYKGIATKAR